MQHRVIEGRIYRVLNIEAADTFAAGRHIMNERPIPRNRPCTPDQLHGGCEEDNQ